MILSVFFSGWTVEMMMTNQETIPEDVIMSGKYQGPVTAHMAL
jgi:hypothetical protein